MVVHKLGNWVDAGLNLG